MPGNPAKNLQFPLELSAVTDKPIRLEMIIPKGVKHTIGPPA